MRSKAPLFQILCGVVLIIPSYVGCATAIDNAPTELDDESPGSGNAAGRRNSSTSSGGSGATTGKGGSSSAGVGSNIEDPQANGGTDGEGTGTNSGGVGGSNANTSGGTSGASGSSNGTSGSGGSSSSGAGGSSSTLPDSQPPSAPGGLSTSNITTSSITLSWTTASDNVGVTGYRLFNGNSEVGTTTATTFTFKSLSAGTSYTLGVEAFDAEDNNSSRSTKSATTSSAPSTCNAGNAVATLVHAQSFSVNSSACIQLSVNPDWDPVNILLEKTSGGTVSFTYTSCAGNGSNSIVDNFKSVQLYTGKNPGCNFFVQLSGSGTVRYYD